MPFLLELDYLFNGNFGQSDGMFVFWLFRLHGKSGGSLARFWIGNHGEGRQVRVCILVGTSESRLCLRGSYIQTTNFNSPSNVFVVCNQGIIIK